MTELFRRDESNLLEALESRVQLSVTLLNGQPMDTGVISEGAVVAEPPALPEGEPVEGEEFFDDGLAEDDQGRAPVTGRPGGDAGMYAGLDDWAEDWGTFAGDESDWSEDDLDWWGDESDLGGVWGDSAEQDDATSDWIYDEPAADDWAWGGGSFAEEGDPSAPGEPAAGQANAPLPSWSGPAWSWIDMSEDEQDAGESWVIDFTFDDGDSEASFIGPTIVPSLL